MRAERTRRALKLRALPAIVFLLLGSICVHSSLLIGWAAGCEMVCCPAHHGGHGDECCALKHKPGKNRSGKRLTAVSSTCPTTCASPPTSGQFFPRGLNREITHSHGIAHPTPLQYVRGRLIYRSFRITPSAPRAPPSFFA